mgnify:FL=1
MSDKKRYIGKQIDASLLPKDKNGNTLCRFCGKSVLPPRRTMCSEECAHEIAIRNNGRYMRNEVYKRDKGICAICNIDTKKIAKEILQMPDHLKKDYMDKYKISEKRKIWKQKNGGGLWDADHIIPVKDGGGKCGLENIRTLCIACHKDVTKNMY